MIPTKNGQIIKNQQRNFFDFIEKGNNDNTGDLENLVIKILKVQREKAKNGATNSRELNWDGPTRKERPHYHRSLIFEG